MRRHSGRAGDAREQDQPSQNSGKLPEKGRDSPNNAPGSGRPSVSPLAFLRALRGAGLTRFDVYAHHAYARAEAPSTRPPGRTAVTLGNVDVLVAELTRLYGPRRLWITEYGYQTNPPDRLQGVSAAVQARYLRVAYGIARRNPVSTCSCGSCSATRLASTAGSPAS